MNDLLVWIWMIYISLLFCSCLGCLPACLSLHQSPLNIIVCVFLPFFVYAFLSLFCLDSFVFVPLSHIKSTSAVWSPGEISKVAKIQNTLCMPKLAWTNVCVGECKNEGECARLSVWLIFTDSWGSEGISKVGACCWEGVPWRVWSYSKWLDSGQESLEQKWNFHWLLLHWLNGESASNSGNLYIFRWTKHSFCWNILYPFSNINIFVCVCLSCLIYFLVLWGS